MLCQHFFELYQWYQGIINVHDAKHVSERWGLMETRGKSQRPGPSGIWDFPPCRPGVQVGGARVVPGWLGGWFVWVMTTTLGEWVSRSQGWWCILICIFLHPWGAVQKPESSKWQGRWRDNKHNLLGFSPCGPNKVRQAFEKKAATKARIIDHDGTPILQSPDTYKNAAQIDEGYAFCQNHGSRKMTSLETKLIFQENHFPLACGRQSSIYWLVQDLSHQQEWYGVWFWGDHCLCPFFCVNPIDLFLLCVHSVILCSLCSHWGSWCLQAKQSIMCHYSSKTWILFKDVSFLVTSWWNFKIQSFHWKRFFPLPGPFEFGRLRVQTATGPSKNCAQNSVFVIDFYYQGSLHYPFGGHQALLFQSFPSFWCIVWIVFFHVPCLS